MNRIKGVIQSVEFNPNTKSLHRAGLKVGETVFGLISPTEIMIEV